MAENDTSSEERTEQPTEKRLREAREKGQIPRSRELNTVISLICIALSMMAFGGGVVRGLGQQMRSSFSFDVAALGTNDSMMSAMGDAATNALLYLAPVFMVMVAAAFIGPVVMGGFAFRGEALVPKFERVDPIKGLGRLFSSQGLMELVKALGKFVLVSVAAWYFFNGVFDELLALGTRPLEGALVESSSLITLCVLLLSSVLILVAAIDVPYQLWQHSTKLKMTRQEVRDEMKETEGRPEVKGRIRSLRQEIAKRRMMRDVKTADVVVRNPTHFAVALKYEQGDVYAPRVVAKGRDLVALAIIEAAEECGVTVLSAPPLARALYATTELGHEIPQKLYIAVAQVLAYVYQLRSAQPWEKASVIEPKDIPVPPELLDDMK